jgi:hypothetical protein
VTFSRFSAQLASDFGLSGGMAGLVFSDSFLLGLLLTLIFIVAVSQTAVLLGTDDGQSELRYGAFSGRLFGVGFTTHVCIGPRKSLEGSLVTRFPFCDSGAKPCHSLRPRDIPV